MYLSNGTIHHKVVEQVESLSGFIRSFLVMHYGRFDCSKRVCYVEYVHVKGVIDISIDKNALRIIEQTLTRLHQSNDPVSAETLWTSGYQADVSKISFDDIDSLGSALNSTKFIFRQLEATKDALFLLARSCEAYETGMDIMTALTKVVCPGASDESSPSSSSSSSFSDESEYDSDWTLWCGHLDSSSNLKSVPGSSSSKAPLVSGGMTMACPRLSELTFGTPHLEIFRPGTRFWTRLKTMLSRRDEA
ncbi:hypothetical protein DFH11DRAFT_638720 [Phellopilus nigrolimitatus]|nr:hypothetical protein DFH11DRAFT_638720 [Phellopilus nigrolimitatus]